ncbi:MAG: DUF4124 domain-containing protein [Luteimonas sp.]
MQNALIGSILALALAQVSASAIAGDVYQWKDANGVSHYSESPPPQGAYKQRTITGAGEAQSTQPVVTAAAENPQCTGARKNMELLQGKSTVQQDTDGDGKPDKTLNDADRANQMELAQAMIKATCASAPAAKP